MADMVMVENNEVAANVTETQEAPAVRLVKKAGAVAIVALAGYGVVSLVKDVVNFGKEIKGAGGLKSYMATKEFKKENQKAEKEKKN